MPHVLIAGKIHQDGIALLKSTPGVTFDFVEEVSAESFLPFLGKAEGVVLRTQPFTAAELVRAPNLRIVSRHGVGFDAVDGKALAARGIPLTIVGDVNSNAVAEHTLMFMLASARRTVAYDQASRSGQWNVRNRFETTELAGKTLLLVGYGRIGRRVGQLASAFGMKIMAFDPFAKDMSGAEPAPDVDSALPNADYVSLHMPGSKGGAIIGEKQLALMKPTATIINTARGDLVDEAALDRALREYRLAAAALDVLVDEPPKSDHPLLRNPKVIISPHSAGLTNECTARMAIAAIQNVLDHFAGKLDRSLVVNSPW